jgi:general secretion pathway protein D
VNDTLTLIKTIAKIQTAAGNPSLGAITVVGTLDQIAWAERIIESNDKARGEVMIEVQILNVNRSKLKQYGLRLSNYGAGIEFLPSGNANESAGGLTKVRAHLLSSFNLADFVVSVPTSLFAKFVQNDSNSRILASPRLRAAEGKKATLKIGQEVPIPVTTFSTVNTGVSSFAPATSFQYRNVGVNLDITPKVSASGDITLELVADFSLLGENRSVGNSGDLPTFFTRTVSGTLRLRDGETSLIGGLLQQAETDSFTGVFGLQSIPLLNKIFTDRDKKSEETEILISITPHIVRGPKLIERDMIPMGVGTSEVPKVEGARPSLFGPEPVPTPIPIPAAPKTPPGAGATRTPPAGSPARPPLPAVLPPVAPPEVAAPVSPLAPATPSPLPGEPTEEPSTSPLAAVSGAGSPAPSPANGSDARAATLLFSPPEASVKVGDKGGLGLVVVGARDVLGVEVVLTYDATLVELAEVGPGSLLTLDGQSVSAERTLEPGRARVRFSRTAPATGSGAIVSVTLKGLRAGSGGLGIESVALLRAGETERPSPPAPGRVIVSP